MRTYLFLLFPIISFSQEITLFDFGSNANSTIHNWNNIIVDTQNQQDFNVALIDYTGRYTGETIELTDSFDSVNESGTTNPNSNLPFINSSTMDNLFGETSPLGGNTNSSGGFVLSNLDQSKYYSFSFFASRMGVTDNRETLYTVIGQNTLTNTLNPTNNTMNTSDIYNIQPDANGEIQILVTPGANNNNSYGFYYLGAIKMISTAVAFTNFNEPSLTLIYPNGNEKWESGKTVSITWENYNLSSDVTIEYSDDNGNSWNSVANVSPDIKKYDWQIPNTISNECFVRISSSSLIDLSENNFSIIDDDNIVYKIIILGSSTAAGTGPEDINDAWVWKYTDYLKHIDTRYEVINLAFGGYTTYNLLPTGTNIPSGVAQVIDTNRNITYALSLNPDGIIINLPSNDASNNYPSSDQIANYHLIINDASTQNTPVWLSTPQPKNFGNDTGKLTIQLEMVNLTPNEFGIDKTLDFWTNLHIDTNNGIKTAYNTDGTHMNSTGHRILFERVKNKGIHTIIKSNVDNLLSLNSSIINSNLVSIFPNPFEKEITLQFDNNSINHINKISFFNVYGKKISSFNANTFILVNNRIRLKPFSNKKQISKGIYYCKIDDNSKSIIKKIVLK